MNKDFLEKVIGNSNYSPQTCEELKKCIPQVINDNILVQTGDVIDRGAYSLATLLYFKTLKEQMSEYKQNGLTGVGDFILLKGNHEFKTVF